MELCNFKYLRSISPNDEKFVTQMIRLFLKNVPVSIEAMKNFKITKDWNSLQHHAHKIRSDINCMGIPKTYGNIAKQIEENAKLQENFDLIPSLVLTLETILLQAYLELEEELNNYGINQKL
ncbi:MAG: Hpt domain-containing protein [Bacteroidota bacterium]|nr:Hpt domain-containing protein [Bacteroidota bacterium]